MKAEYWILVLALGLAIGCNHSQRNQEHETATEHGSQEHGTLVSSETADDDEDDSDVDVPIDEVPQAIKDAAVARLPGFVITEAEREVENGVTLYSLEGTVDGQSWEVEVGLDGTIIEVEQEDDETEDDD